MPIQSLTIPLIPGGPRFPITLPSKLILRNLEGGGRPRGSNGSLMRGTEGHLKPISDHIVDSGTSRVWKSRSLRKKKTLTLLSIEPFEEQIPLKLRFIPLLPNHP